MILHAMHDVKDHNAVTHNTGCGAAFLWVLFCMCGKMPVPEIQTTAYIETEMIWTNP